MGGFSVEEKLDGVCKFVWFGQDMLTICLPRGIKATSRIVTMRAIAPRMPIYAQGQRKKIERRVLTRDGIFVFITILVKAEDLLH